MLVILQVGITMIIKHYFFAISFEKTNDLSQWKIRFAEENSEKMVIEKEISF